MLEINVPGQEWFDETTSEFSYSPATVLKLEHSLISISKWEMKWCKPFLDYRKEKTREESLDYIRCMTIGKEPDPLVYSAIDNKTIAQVNAYMDAPMTATWFAKNGPGGNGKGMSKEIITNEIIYYWMIRFRIPFECEKWHLNRLLTLIRVANVKESGPGKKMSKRELIQRNAALNAQRRAKLNTKG